MKDGHLPDGFDPKVKNRLGAQILPMQVLHWLQMPGHVLVEPQECQCPVLCPIEGCWPVPPSPLPSLLQGHLVCIPCTLFSTAPPDVVASFCKLNMPRAASAFGSVDRFAFNLCTITASSATSFSVTLVTSCPSCLAGICESSCLLYTSDAADE